eukprot:CAMPEP_0194374678 /NCGR_PEP_ID=MMETSP0174-20130528/23121_1 /TAXON_ID=216777 /ORGANISM="Proboscia alata, Strain PI-D3" /LENGTH=132 /DNA_ID=CAMNT_0039154401 /DNA_START=73 /DNA_END=468 /DNA_ORIENTATION=+
MAPNSDLKMESDTNIIPSSLPSKPYKQPCPSYNHASHPDPKDVDRYKSLARSHIDGFDYFLEEGLSRGISDIEPMSIDLVNRDVDVELNANANKKVDLGSVQSIRCWVENPTLAMPLKNGSTSGVSTLTTRN